MDNGMTLRPTDILTACVLHRHRLFSKILASYNRRMVFVMRVKYASKAYAPFFHVYICTLLLQNDIISQLYTSVPCSWLLLLLLLIQSYGVHTSYHSLIPILRWPGLQTEMKTRGFPLLGCVWICSDRSFGCPYSLLLSSFCVNRWLAYTNKDLVLKDIGFQSLSLRAGRSSPSALSSDTHCIDSLFTGTIINPSAVSGGALILASMLRLALMRPIKWCNFRRWVCGAQAGV